MEGAAYGVYSDRGATRENAVFTTDKNGESNTLELEEGMYYVKEKKAPKGYKLDERIYLLYTSAHRPLHLLSLVYTIKF